MATLSEVERRVKKELRLASGLEILVSSASGPIHGKTVVKLVAVEKFMTEARANEGSMRVADFCKRYARCIGGQIGATVSLRFLDVAPDGRLAVGKFMAA